jgi:hypothetical protein
MERNNPLARMHGAGGPSSPRGGVANRNVSARHSEAEMARVAALRHSNVRVCPTLCIGCFDFSAPLMRS